MLTENKRFFAQIIRQDVVRTRLDPVHAVSKSSTWSISSDSRCPSPFSTATSQIISSGAHRLAAQIFSLGSTAAALVSLPPSPARWFSSLRRSPLATARAGISWFVDASIPSTLLELAIDGREKEARAAGRLSEGGDSSRIWFEYFSAGCFGFRGDLRFSDSKVRVCVCVCVFSFTT